MSSGAFQLAKYEANDGTSIYPVRLQPETLAAEFDGTANDEPAGATNQPIFAQVSRANGGYGVRPRKITVRFTAAPPTGYKADQTYDLAIMTAALWNAAVPGQTGTYLGVATQVVSKAPESIR